MLLAISTPMAHASMSALQASMAISLMAPVNVWPALLRAPPATSATPSVRRVPQVFSCLIQLAVTLVPAQLLPTLTLF